MEKDAGYDCDVIHQDIVDMVRGQILPQEEFDRLSNLYKMFADSTRVKILWALDKSEMCVCDIAVLLNMTKSAISHHLKTLRLSNLVKTRKSGKVVFYSLSDDHVTSILNLGIQHIKE